ncbi:50S ribosomal protein L30 [Ruminococcaceae bacterium OttesenSCG-928-A16]|nr:50S ribosomal protein L30 [Ruminococcaceae bacterium OttesenSCG-928-A16]
MAAGTIKITLKKALTGRKANQIAVAASLGLKRVGDVTIQPDNAATNGKIAKISFLLAVSKA